VGALRTRRDAALLPAAGDRLVPQPREDAGEDLVRLGPGDEDPAVDHEGRDAADPEPESARGRGTHLIAPARLGDRRRRLPPVEPDGLGCIEQHPLLEQVPALGPVVAEEAVVQGLGSPLCPGVGGQRERARRVRDARGQVRPGQPGLRDQVPDRVLELLAVAALELLTRDSLRRVLGVEVEGPDLYLGAVPAL
jgi:hypothetical protein